MEPLHTNNNVRLRSRCHARTGTIRRSSLGTARLQHKSPRRWTWTSGTVSSVCSTITSLTFHIAMVSASSKRNLAFGSMALTKLKELKGYPCGRFS